jgi:hypothetical protein
MNISKFSIWFKHSLCKLLIENGQQLLKPFDNKPKNIQWSLTMLTSNTILQPL